MSSISTASTSMTGPPRGVVKPPEIWVSKNPATRLRTHGSRSAKAMKSLTTPGMISRSPAMAPSRLLAAPPETVFLSLAGVFSMVNMLVPLRRIRALPAKMSRMTSARTGKTPTNRPSQMRDARSANRRTRMRTGKWRRKQDSNRMVLGPIPKSPI